MPPIDSTPLLLALIALGAYFLGSVPFGIVITRVLGLGDLRQIGSGNIGATNVLRTGSKPAAFATLLLDSGKGAIAVLAARAIAGEDAAQIAGLFSFIGHIWPVWLKFHGGKGVATLLGIVLALSFPVGFAACTTWMVATAAFRISSLSALVTVALAPLWALMFGQSGLIVLLIILGVLVFWRHSENISRLLSRTEPKIGGNK